MILMLQKYTFPTISGHQNYTFPTKSMVENYTFPFCEVLGAALPLILWRSRIAQRRVYVFANKLAKPQLGSWGLLTLVLLLISTS